MSDPAAAARAMATDGTAQGPTRGARGKASPIRDQVRILETAEGFFGAQILFTLNDLGVFDRLGGRPMGAVELADAIGADHGATERLLNAAVAADLLEVRDGLYASTPLAGRVLTEGSEGYLGHWLRWMAHLSRAWTGLTDSVREGRPVVDSSRFLGGDEAFTRDFILGMEDYAWLRGADVVRYLDLDGGLRLLDVGGASGAYAILFARRWPDLQVTIFDLPPVVAIAEDRIAAVGFGDRVSVAAGDYHRDEVGEDYDVVFISDVLHQESPPDAAAILVKCFRALRPGGRIVVQGMFLNEDRTSPRWPAMHSLILLLVYGGGRAYTIKETIGLLEGAGFRDPRHKRMSLTNVNSLIIASRP